MEKTVKIIRRYLWVMLFTIVIGLMCFTAASAQNVPPPSLFFSGYVSTLAGSAAGFNDAQGSSAKFYEPSGIVIDADGNLLVADQLNNRIRKITMEGVVTTFAGTAVAGHNDGPAATAQFKGPVGLAIDADGNVYVSEYSGHYIRKISTDGMVSTLAGNGQPGLGDGTGSAAKFNVPVGLAVDAAGNVYVADAGNHAIRKVTQAGVVTTIAGSDKGSSGNVDGHVSDARFQYPFDIGLDNTGVMYVADYMNKAVRKIDTNGNVSTIATLGKQPTGIHLGPNGKVYVTESTRIQTISQTGALQVFAGTVSSGDNDGLARVAQFYAPRDLISDAIGNFYITDQYNHRIRKISAASLELGTVAHGTASAPKSFFIHAEYLNGDALLTAPAGFEISLSSASGYTSELTFAPAGDISMVPLKEVFIRLSASGTPGSYNVNATLSSDGAVTQTLPLTGVIEGLTQVLTFDELPAKTYGAPSFALNASASSGLEVSYTSSNTSVAVVEGSLLTIVGAGTSTITASQTGGAYTAVSVSRELVVSKADQFITFGSVNNKTVGVAPFSVEATSSSGLPVTFTTSSGTISVVGTLVSIVGAGYATVTATQPGNANYNAAAAVDRSFCVNPAKPTISGLFSDDGTFTLTSSATVGNRWYLDGDAITDAASASLVVGTAGEYQVQVIAGECVSELSEQYSVVITALEEFNKDMEVYPNPAKDFLIVKGIPASSSVRLMTTTGVERTLQSALADDELKIDVRDLTPGMYIIHARGKNGLRQIKFVKQ